MKKTIFSIISAAFIVGSGAVVFAEGPIDNVEKFNFGQLKEHMQEMHPDMTTEDLKNMYESCHGTNGAMPSKNFNMMDHNDMKMMMNKF